MNAEDFGVVNWRDLDLKQDIHYCDQNQSEKSNVYKKRDTWWIWEENFPIYFCPYCGVNLEEIAPTEE